MHALYAKNTTTVAYQSSTEIFNEWNLVTWTSATELQIVAITCCMHTNWTQMAEASYLPTYKNLLYRSDQKGKITMSYTHTNIPIQNLFNTRKLRQTMQKLCTHCESCASMGCATNHCMISSVQSPSQNSCMHPTPGGDSPTPTTDRRSLLSFVTAFALVSVLQI